MTQGHRLPPLVDLAAVVAAAIRIRSHISRTPVLTSRTFNALVGAEVFFKCENLQRIGAFKARGAHNAVYSLEADLARCGVVTHSSGNHAAALCLAARNRGIRAYIVMPENGSAPKVDSVRRLGGEITFCAPTLDARIAMADAIVAKTGATLIPPYDDARVIAGQGTAALELAEEIPSLDAIIAPVGGGGLLSGTAVVAKEWEQPIKAYGAEPAAADDAHRSFKSGTLITGGTPQTIADGLRVTLGEIPFAYIAKHVDDIFLVPEEDIVQAMRLTWEVLKQVIEPSAAVPVAALLLRKLPPEHRRIGVILSGGNVDLAALPWRPRPP